MGLRIGIDVGGTFTHGVVLEPPGSVIARARTPTTHTDARGVAAGVEQVLTLLLDELGKLSRSADEVELVAHSTTQATNALLEGDLSAVHLLAIAPPGERGLVARSLRARKLPIGGGHSIQLWPKLLEDWRNCTPERWPDKINNVESVAAAASRHDGQDGAASVSRETPPQPGSRTGPPSGAVTYNRPGWDAYGVPPGFTVSEDLPVAVVQPLAGKQENREQTVAAHYRACGHAAVCASEITQVLGLKVRARTAIVNAAMLPTMLATADYTEAAVARMLPGVPLQVVRSDGGAMSIAEMRRQPILSLLSGPAAGASAALHLSGLSDAVFIEVGGTSTDITLIKDGRVRHRYATVGGQRLMVPALDLRTVAVGGGSMLRADIESGYGSRSAHIVGLPYLFQAVAEGRTFRDVGKWIEGFGFVRSPRLERQLEDIQVIPSQEVPSAYRRNPAYFVAEMEDGGFAALTITDLHLSRIEPDLRAGLAQQFGTRLTKSNWEAIDEAFKTVDYRIHYPDNAAAGALWKPIHSVSEAVRELAREHGMELNAHVLLVGGGGGAPLLLDEVAKELKLTSMLIPDHAVISAIGAALAVTCVSLSRNVAQPSSADIAAMVDEVEAKLAAQGAERVSTDYEFDPRRQVLTVTGRGSRPYEQDARVRSEAELLTIASDALKANAEPVWNDQRTYLWTAADTERRPLASRRTGRPRSSRLACATDTLGRILWQGKLAAYQPALAGGVETALADVVARYTQHTDGGALLPGLGLLTGGHYLPLDQLGEPALIAEVLRWEKLPADASGCFIVKA